MHLDLSTIRQAHLLGIGGIGVSAVARLLRARGIQVSGSDVRCSSITRSLEQEGVIVHIGHREENLDQADLVVVSTAIPESNPELQAARRRGLPVVHRSFVLGALMEGRRAIGVTGTNGKGSVSAMTTFLLDQGGLRPAFAIGAILLDYGTNARETGASHLVCEIDESDGSCANTRPGRLVVNNLEADHLHHYRNLEGLVDHFSRWLSRPDSPPFLHVAGDDERCREVLRRSGREAVTFGTDPSCGYRMTDLRLEGLGSRFRAFGPGGDLGEFRVSLPGAHNAHNALAALSVALEEGVPLETIREALPRFRGLENRFTLVPAGPCLIVKDYISHPSGIRSVLRGARVFAPGRLVAVFKPYRFTMIHYLGDEYREAFREADLVFVTELYTAGEVPIPGVDAAWLVRRIGESGREVVFVPDEEDLLPRLRGTIRPDDTVIFFGGDDLFVRADVLAAELGPPTIRLRGVP